MKKFIFLTCMPTPYRTSFYNELYKMGFNFEVFYMIEKEADRSWVVDLTDLKHPFYIDSGFYFMYDRFHIHFNPMLILKILRSKNAEIIIGAGWNDPDVILLTTFKRLGLINNIFHFWTEANFLTIGARNDNFIKRSLRKYVYNSTLGSQLISGKMTELTLIKWGIRVNKFIPLPNTIQEEIYIINDEEITQRNKNEIPVFIMPVRLHEKIKGIINFFNAIGVDNIKKGVFLIAGDGPDKAAIESFITAHNVNDNIKLLGHCSERKLNELYKSANVFILPSFTDASPLVLIEALKMNLPVIVSNRCGNHFESVIDSYNGFLFDPSDKKSIKNAFEMIIFKKNEWINMGNNSYMLYCKNFNKKSVIQNFIKKITE